MIRLLIKTLSGFLSVLLFLTQALSAPAPKRSFQARRSQLLSLLGRMPAPPPLQAVTLESVQLENGWRYKIEYLAEKADPLFGEPDDKIRAYLFVPHHKLGTKLPAIIAIHQDGPQSHIGKSEPAGLAGADDQHYGVELFKRGYVVICPDRVGHAERRRVMPNDLTSIDEARDDMLLEHRAGQLLLKGRTFVGKEVYDLMRATDVLYSLNYVNMKKIGAIGHSAGGYIMVYFMFADPRINAGVSSCGFFELLNFFNEHAPKRRSTLLAIPGLSGTGKSADYLALVAPRPVFLTRGMWEWGKDGEWGDYSRRHVQETREIESYARSNYAAYHAADKLQVTYFDDGGGDHAFPQGIRQTVYQWLDKQLLKK
jgi:dienelactone hydrolase